MSDRTRISLGDVEDLSATLAAHPSLRFASFRFTRVWTARDRMLLSGEFSESAPDEAALVLLGVQNNLLRHFFQLQRAERILAARTGHVRRSGGSAAIRQMELERQRLGRELHTGVGQQLAAIRMQLEIIGGQLPEPSIMVLQALGRISTLAADALEQVRTISKRLHPPEWQRMPLETAIRQLWENSGIPERYESTLDLQPLPVEPPLEVKVLLYRTVQEVFSNVVRHARATRITIRLEAREANLVLTIQDDGVGFNVAKVMGGPPNISAGIGLRTIRDQSAAIGGKLEAESGSGGTKLVVTVPYNQQD